MKTLKLCCVLICLVIIAGSTFASDRLDTRPSYERYTFIRDNLNKLVKGGTISNLTWSEDGATLEYTRDEIRYQLDLGTKQITDLEWSEEELKELTKSRRRRRGPARGFQRDVEVSPDGTWNAKSVDWNVVLERADDLGGIINVTTDGTRKIRFGKASWVYGEELRQTDAMFWSPDSSKLAYYELDESRIKDFYLIKNLNTKRTELLTEGYPKPGEPNPVARLWIYDLKEAAYIAIDVGDDPENYIFKVRFSPNGEVLLFNRTNRRQNVLELVAADPATGESRVVVRETQDTWQKNNPEIRFLDDGQRFIWETEKTGWKNYELRNLDGTFIRALTNDSYPANAIKHVDEESGYLYFTAFSETSNPLLIHLHRVGLDGQDRTRLTEAGLSHTVTFSDDGKWYVDRVETNLIPPKTTLSGTSGLSIISLGKSDTSMAEAEGISDPEQFTCQAEDGTVLYGMLYKPSHFDPRKIYPLLLDVYGGPLSKRVHARYRNAYPETEFGFLIAIIDNRGTTGRGKAFETANYLRLGDVDIADQVAGVKELIKRPYIDGSRVGVFGHSYGGYMSALAITKYPEVFHVSVAGGTVVDWRQYDTIYTERFMRTPQENLEGYDEGSVLQYAEQLEGKLLLLHGMVDDNVHPTNFWQLTDALQKADKRFEMMLYPTRGHGLGKGAMTARWEFLCENLLGDEVSSEIGR